MTDAYPSTTHYTELQPVDPGSPLYREWETYRREVGRLLAEGLEGRWVLIKGEQILGTWGTQAEALREGNRRYLLQGFFIHEILEHEPILRGTLFRQCRSSPSPAPRPG